MKNPNYDILLLDTTLRNYFADDHTHAGERTYKTTMYSPHCHPHYEVLYVYENERIITFDRKKYILSKNKICFIPPYTMHKVQPANNMPQKRILLEFTKEYIEKYAQPLIIDPLNIFSNGITILSVPDTDVPELKSILSMIVKYSKKYDNYCMQMFALCTLQLLTFCTEKLFHVKPTDKPDIVSDIIKYLEVHYHEDITLDMLADEFNISKYEISRKFPKATGMSFSHHLTRIRIENAKRLLENHTLSVTNVGTHTGFRNSSDFARVFKSVTGMTPSQYRKTNKNT